MVAVAGSFACGIGLAPLCRHYAFGGLAAAVSMLIAAAFLSYLKTKPLLTFTLAQSAVLSCGMLLALAHRDGYGGEDLRTLLSRQDFPLNQPVLFEGRIKEGGPIFGEEIEVVVEIRRFRRKNRWIAAKGKGVLSIVPADPADRSGLKDSLVPGVDLRAWAVWKAPRNFENPGSADRIATLARRGIFLTGRTKSSRLIESLSRESFHPLTILANFIRKKVRGSLEPIRDGGDGQAAAILACLLVGDQSALDGGTREIFQNAGCFHILVVSGLHVAWIAGAWLVLARFMRIPYRLRYASAAGLILLYAWTVGFQAGITRCLWMFLLYLAGRLILRRADAANIIFSAAWILLAANPGWLYHAGFQLSFLSVSAIVLTAVPAIDRWLMPALLPLKNAGDPDRLFLEPSPGYRWGRKLRTRFELFAEWADDALPFGGAAILRPLARLAAYSGIFAGSMILLSAAVQIWIAPLVGFYFNRISWIAPLSNPAIVPLASLSLASGISAAAAAGVPFCGPALVRFAGAATSLLLDLSGYVNGIAGAWQRCPTPPAAAVLAGILLLLLWKFFRWNRFWIPCVYVLALTGFTACGALKPPQALFQKALQTITAGKTAKASGGNTRLSITFLDVGEGDSIVIRFPNRRLWVLDAGRLHRNPSGGDGFDTGEAVVSRYLWHQWAGNPDRVLLSHTDIDHAGGIPALLRNFRVACLYHPASRMDPILSGILQVARRRKTQARPVHAGMEEKVGPVTVRVLHPQPGAAEPSENDNSLVLHFTFKNFTALLTGDLEKRGESELLALPANLECLLLKVAHHGSRSGTSSAFLDAVRPRWAVVSAGRDNPFGHPSPEVLMRLERRGVRVHQTLNEGAVTFSTDGISYEISSHVGGVLEGGTLE
ncbi:MAG: ComEC/Rec2 family competence protein [Acidobacteria bacterium]|nr:ComEC/Rec2 family competence protein [Acidobacteriota bacterium]